MSFYNSFEEIFQEMKKRLTLTPTAMKLWIEPLKPLKLNNNHVMLYVESQFSKDMTMANFKTVFQLLLYCKVLRAKNLDFNVKA